jgi:hypothetical protein
MKFDGFVSVDHVIEAFREDHRVLTVTKQWPDTAFLRAVVVRLSGRPVEKFLKLAWKQCELDRDQLLSTVYPVWPKPGTNQNYSWILRDMIAALKAGSFSPPDPAKVQALSADMKANPPKQIGPLIGYQCSNGIYLEDGTNRLAAAGTADVIPATVVMYIGVQTPASP